jgi:hypothetical protein
MKQTILKEFDGALAELNAQLWMLLALCAHGSDVAARAKPLDGHAFDQSLRVLLPGCEPYLDRIRLRKATMSSDLGEGTARTESWLPAYFVVLTKSLAEGTLRQLVHEAIANAPQVRVRFNAYRRGPKQSAAKAEESLAAAAARGDFVVVQSVIDLTAQRPALSALSTQLSRYNTLRNSMAHRLGDQLRAAATINPNSLKDYLKAVQELVRTFAQAC